MSEKIESKENTIHEAVPFIPDASAQLFMGYHLVATVRAGAMTGCLNKALSDYVSKALKPLSEDSSPLSQEDRVQVTACMNFIRGVANAHANNVKKSMPTDFKKISRKLHKFMVFFQEKFAEQQ